MRRQKEGEPVDSFTTSPASPASRTLQLYISYMLKRSDIGLLWAYEIQIYHRLQTYPELNLDKAITMARRTEAVREGSGKGRDRQHLHKN